MLLIGSVGVLCCCQQVALLSSQTSSGHMELINVLLCAACESTHTHTHTHTHCVLVVRYQVSNYQPHTLEGVSPQHLRSWETPSERTGRIMRRMLNYFINLWKFSFTPSALEQNKFISCCLGSRMYRHTCEPAGRRLFETWFCKIKNRRNQQMFTF